MHPQTVFEKLSEKHGPQGWWPVSDSVDSLATYKKRDQLTGFQQFEVCVGAILTQNTAWKNVERAIQNLKQKKMFSLEKIAHSKPKTVAQLIRPTGYFNQKTKRLQLFCRQILKKHEKIPVFLGQPKEKLRTELLELHGIGPETADSIILYGARQPAFVVDAYTRRFVERFYNKKMNYDQTQKFFETQLPKNAELFNEYHALIVEHAKQYCKTTPDCANCFLKPLCEYGKQKPSLCGQP